MPPAEVRAGCIRFGAFRLDVRSRELFKGSTRLKVPDQSVQVLLALVERPGEVVTRDELRHRLWPDDTFVDFEQGLNGVIRRLRDALGDSADAPRVIETLPRRGYRFIGAVETSTPTFEPAVPVIQHRPSLDARPFRTRAVLVIAGIVLALGIGTWFGRGRIDRPGNGSEPLLSVPVTSFPGAEMDPAISPDGNHVAFAWARDDGTAADIYVKLIDGGAPLRLSDSPARERDPAWSPDGKRIAFLRLKPDGRTIVVIVPAFGGPDRELAATLTAIAPRWNDGVAWSTDGRWVLFADRLSASAPSAIVACSVETGERRSLTTPPAGFEDARPAMSPDGRYLGFLRRVAGAFSGFVALQPLEGLRPVGDLRQLTRTPRTREFDWAGTDSLIYDARQGLVRIELAGGPPRPLLTNVTATHPSVSRDGLRLVYERGVGDVNIWRLPGPEGNTANGDRSSLGGEKLVASTFADTAPQFSPGGDRIVFASNRSGTSDIWVAESDGSQPMQITHGGSAGSPRWSADGESIVFDVLGDDKYHVYTVGSQGGATRAITTGASNNVRASWSRDNRWIYFGSDRGGAWQIWKVPSVGGDAIQITKFGGVEAFEAPDGKYLYYAKDMVEQGIWRVPVGGGEETMVVDHGRHGFFGVANGGIALMNPLAKPAATIEFLSFQRPALTQLGSLPAGLRFGVGGPGFGISWDGRWILYSRLDQWGSDIHAVEGLR